MPILDNKVRIDSKKVDWSFYKKPVDSELFILNRSALSNRIKKASLSQEGLRRLRNTRPDKVEERKGKLLVDMAEGISRAVQARGPGSLCHRLPEAGCSK